MTEKIFDIAIIGGGIIGLSLARALRGEKLRIAVIDAAAEIPSATNASAGMLAPSFEMGGALDEALYAFSAKSLAMWPDFAGALEGETGLPVDYRSDGILGIAYDDAGALQLARDCEALKTRGGDVDMISGDEARTLEPALSQNVTAALHAKKDAQVDPRKALLALRAAVAKKLGQIFDQRVERVEEKSGAYGLHLAGGASLTAEKIVLASGAAPGAQVPGLPLPPVYPVKGEAAAFVMPEGAFRRVIRAPGAYLCPKAGGRLIIGATEVKDRNDYEVDAASIARLAANGARAVPAVADYQEIERWAGMRPATPDRAPILGRDTRGPEGVFLALGHYRSGILLAPASATALAAEIRTGAAADATAAFRPERFTES